MAWRSLALLGMGRGEPVAFEFSLKVETLTPWPAMSRRPLRRLALKWSRGAKVRRTQLVRCMHPTRP
jgi:hypothetical protein